MSTIKQALDQFRTERTTLEADIRTSIATLTAAFYEKTGVQVSGVSVGMTRMDLIGMPPEFLLGEVDVDTPLG